LDPDLRHAPGSVAGAAALVAGTTVGAGILALPAATAGVGFGATAAALAGGWAFSLASGLLLAELALQTLCVYGRGGGAGVGALASATLGPGGAAAAGAAYLFLHYCLLVAYIGRGGEIMGWAAEAVAGSSFPPAVSAALFIAPLATACYAASPSTLDAVNGALLVAVLATFAALVALAAPGVDPASLASLDHASALPAAASVVALAFVYQNVVGVVCSSLEGDPAKVRAALAVGSGVPLLMFLAWVAVVDGNSAVLESMAGGGGGSGGDPVAALALSLPPPGSTLIDAFSLAALASSAVGFILGLSEFVAEEATRLTGAEEPVLARSPGPYLATLAPPFAGALLAPGAFAGLLSAAGTYGVLVLFGVLPAVMAAVARGRAPDAPRLVPGGSLGLALVGGLAGAVIVNETVARLGGGGGGG
jgi:tyrosine-specific transport protein